MAHSDAATWDGKQLLAGLQAATRWLEQHVGEVNALNVFPVPDGDTGTNMHLTMMAAIKDVPAQASAAAVAKQVERQALRGARGNSGVILSQIIRGFSEGVTGQATIDGAVLAQAFGLAAERAYKAVMKPTEGTILTVARVVGERTREAVEGGATLAIALEAAVAGADQAVVDTPKQLKQLRDAGVVDAGGQGLAVILHGLLRFARGEEIERADGGGTVAVVAFEDIHSDDDFGYCTNFLLEGANIPFEAVREHIAAMGRSVVVVGDETTVKAHIHTLRPGDVLNYAMDFGALTHVEIANMDAQRAAIHDTGTVSAVASKEPKEGSVAERGAPSARNNGRAEHLTPFGIVAIAPGPGFEQVFQSVNVDEVVTGGQTMNPSTQDLVEAIERVPRQEVLVLPNNSNILMAARQAQELVDKTVEVIPSRTVPQGIAAILALNFEQPFEANVKSMTKAIGTIRTLEITTAVRDAVVDDTEVRTGQTIGLLDDKLIAAGDDQQAVIDQMLDSVEMDDYEVVTIYLGEGVDEARGAALAEHIQERFPDLVSVEVAPGGQPFYDFIISLE
jgi:DAK2 domain fusion protein YloV